MACRNVLSTLLLTGHGMHLPFIRRKTPKFSPIVSSLRKVSTSASNFGCKLSVDDKCYHRVRNCSNSGSLSSSNDESEQEPPLEAVLKAISEVSKTEGRVGQTTNVVVEGTVTDDSTSEWLALDQKVNSYPTIRIFTAIGTGGDDFVRAMVVAVESVLQMRIPEGQVKQKISSGGKYVSVNIGPVQVVSGEQVQAVYSAMRRDNRMKYSL